MRAFFSAAGGEFGIVRVLHASLLQQAVDELGMIVPGQIQVIAQIVHRRHHVLLHILLVCVQRLTVRHAPVHILRGRIQATRLRLICQIVDRGNLLVNIQILARKILLAVVQLMIGLCIRVSENRTVQLRRQLHRQTRRRTSDFCSLYRPL